MTAPLSQVQTAQELPETREGTAAETTPATAQRETSELPHPHAEPGSAELAPYWVERKRYLKEVKRIPELRQRFWSAILVYLLRRVLWSFGFFPIFIAFWVPLVMASFNPVIMVNDILPDLQAFVAANPEVQANRIQTLLIAWLSIGFAFLVFDFVLTPFRSPYEYEADVYMRAWEQRHASPARPLVTPEEQEEGASQG
ncbi:hypothetical protein RE428_19800 [Marinobacter nanhaiticus D15-8W]|uniref:hypothetical protein n=1 Tax=Marinobacter nanhaiticus TaxID=1305740 RepID=UPI0002C9698B|nr:hypothetical protein [Marinobacter nanhaiticus]BES70962.1 hypothetical protein RE428_19800 [Marinobacter nanhaiticus D15-8W]